MKGIGDQSENEVWKVSYKQDYEGFITLGASP